MNDMLIYAVIIGFVGYGVSNLLVVQEGPYDIFLKIREYFGIIEFEDTLVIDTEKEYFLSKVFIRNEHNLIAGILSCQYCAGFWVIVFATIVSIFSIKLLLPFAALGVLYSLLEFTK